MKYKFTKSIQGKEKVPHKKFVKNPDKLRRSLDFFISFLQARAQLFPKLFRLDF